MNYQQELVEYLIDYKDKIEKAPLMHGGSLMGVEALWLGISTIQGFIRDSRDEIERARLARQAYEAVATKYKCGNWTLASKAEDHYGQTVEAGTELVRWLREIDEVRRTL